VERKVAVVDGVVVKTVRTTVAVGRLVRTTVVHFVVVV
jgi:hypothetical protein